MFIGLYNHVQQMKYESSNIETLFNPVCSKQPSIISMFQSLHKLYLNDCIAWSNYIHEPINVLTLNQSSELNVSI